MRDSNQIALHWQEGTSLANYSTYKIGGPAKFFVKVKTFEEMKEALMFCQREREPYYILGKGSNTLFDDRGYNGVVILNNIHFLEKDPPIFYAGAGVSFARLGQQLAKLGFEGLEYAIGIPGSLGGAIYMNAGANNQEIAPLVEEVTYLNESNEIEVLSRKELSFGYRTSCFHRKRGVILAAKLKLVKNEEARAHQISLITKRKESQPLSEASCGCIFRNDPKIAAGALIDQMGLKGKKINGAQISEKHANFIVNTGGAKAQDVKKLVELIEAKAKEKGIKLQREIRFVAYEENNGSS